MFDHAPTTKDTRIRLKGPEKVLLFKTEIDTMPRINQKPTWRCACSSEHQCGQNLNKNIGRDQTKNNSLNTTVGKKMENIGCNKTVGQNQRINTGLNKAVGQPKWEMSV